MLNNEVKESRCFVCQLGMPENGDPERLSVVNRWLADGRKYSWISRSIKDSWGEDISETSISRHYKLHLPQRYKQAREAIEQALGRNYADMELTNIAILNYMKAVGANDLTEKLERGDVEIHPQLLLQIIKEQQDIITKKTVSYKEKVVPNKAFDSLLKIMTEMVPSNRHIELRERISNEVIPFMDEEPKEIEEKAGDTNE